MTANDTPSRSQGEAEAALVDAIVDAVGDGLRDVWVLDAHTQEPLYLREDVADHVSDIEVEKFLDNERYGFVTRQTYDLLHYSEFKFTHRGFDTWELFRTFIVDGDTEVGVVVGLDTGENYDFRELDDAVQSLGEEYGAAAFAPDDED